MNQRYGLRNYTKCILLAALMAAMVYGTAAPAFADSQWLSDRIAAIKAPSSHETERAERVRAVENARVAFEQVKAARGEKAAPYEFYLAKGFLALAREELSEGDKLAVIQFAEESEKYSRVAGEKAKMYLKLAGESLGTGDKIGVVHPPGESGEHSHVAGEKAEGG